MKFNGSLAGHRFYYAVPEGYSAGTAALLVHGALARLATERGLVLRVRLKPHIVLAIARELDVFEEIELGEVADEKFSFVGRSEDANEVAHGAE